MRGLWYRLLILWYRLGGNTPAQAQWRARRKLQPPEALDGGEPTPDGAKRRPAARPATADSRFKCVCGQLMVKDDRVCSRCDRRQLMPFWMRRIARALNLRDVSDRPVATFAVLGTMVLGYLAQVRFGSGSFFSPSKGFDMIMLGASVPSLTLGEQPWRAFTYTMVHGGLMHVAFNGIALVQLGPMVEARFGKARFMAAWVFGAIGGAFLADLLSPSALRPLVGASGAVFALIGMAGVQGHRQGTSQGRQIRNTMIFWAVMTTVLGAGMGGVSHAAHFGGGIVGVIIAFGLRPPDYSATQRRLSPGVGMAAVLTMLLAIGGLVGWHVVGNPVPQGLSVPLQAALYRANLETRGADVVYTEDGGAILRRARRSDGLGEAARVRIFKEAMQVSADWVPVRRDLFRRDVLEGLGLYRSAQPDPRRKRPPSNVEQLQRPL
ncbi:MAG: membrane associated rhomboid family serine protease [Bradymonadia bacterium]|jgi:membrane associated rhomboid family serine protease